MPLPSTHCQQQPGRAIGVSLNSRCHAAWLSQQPLTGPSTSVGERRGAVVPRLCHPAAGCAFTSCCTRPLGLSPTRCW